MITRSVVLPCSQDRAFALFTTQISLWWPPARRHTSDPTSAITLDPSGDFFEQAADGTRVDLGRVREWRAPERIVLDFYPGTDPQHPTEATITFALAEGGTRVRVEHRPTDLSRDLWESRAPRFDESWDAVLHALADWPAARQMGS